MRLTAKYPVGLRFKAVELKVDRWPHLVELLHKSLIAGDALAVRIEHDEPDVAALRGADEVDDPRMNGRFTAGELDNLGLTFGPDIVVEHLLDFLEGKAESRRGIGKAKRTIHVARTVHLDDPEACMLLMVRT